MSDAHPHLSPTTLADAHDQGLKDNEWQIILDALGRTPNMTELGIFGVMWSEHCSYKSSKVHLKTLPTKAPWVICGPGENAGVIDIGDGQAAIFKMESHNHPSQIEPFQGSATGVGGILRDVFTMGARPIANINALRFGDPSAPRMRDLIKGVVSGIGHYGNCVGVPTVGGEVNFHPRYNGNILVNAMTVGLADTDKIFYAAGAKPGLPIVYTGAKTGKDGIKGASMASATFSADDAQDQRPTVQVGDPFVEKLLIEACLELMASDAIVSIQDMGAAGLTSSSVEIASKGNIGVVLDLDAVPLREADMTPYEIMLSESQERMLMILKPGREEEARAIFHKWGLDCVTIGRTTDDGHLKLNMHGQCWCDIPVPPLVDKAPEYTRPVADSPEPLALTPIPLHMDETHLSYALKLLISCPDLSSKRWIWEQYDSLVRGDTVFGPGQADAALVRVNDKGKALAISSDCCPRYGLADPYLGGLWNVVETYRNITATGATPLAWTNNLNFGDPTNPVIMGQLASAVKGMGDAGRALDYPVISGNVSLYNATDGVDILPTPVVAGVGLIKDASKATGIAIPKAGLHVTLVGRVPSTVGQSLYLREIHKSESGAPPRVDLALEKQVADAVRDAIAKGDIVACHDVSDGGTLVALAEMMIASTIDAGIALEGMSDPTIWFGEGGPAYIALSEKPLKLAVATLALGMTTDDGSLTMNEKPLSTKTELHALNDAFLYELMEQKNAA